MKRALTIGKFKAARILKLITLSFIVGAVCAMFVSCSTANMPDEEIQKGDGAVITRLSAGGEDVILAEDEKTSLTAVVYGSAPYGGVAKYASTLSGLLYKHCGIDLDISPYSSSSATKDIIVLGRTDIELSKRLADEVDSFGADYHAWGIAYEGGVLALYATTKTATDDSEEVFTDLFDALVEYIADGRLTVKEGLFRTQAITEAEYQRLLDEKVLAERDGRIEALKELIGGFTDSDFDSEGLGITTDMVKESGVNYGSPMAYPTVGEHPRVLFTSEDIPAIVAAMNNSENKDAVNDFWLKVKTAYTGILPAPTDRTSKKGNHNYDYTGLAIIQSKAFAYVITEDEEYGYQAIYAMLNYIKTLDVNWMYLDLYREYGYVMYTAACVYDWCYSLLTENDKTRMTLGIEHLICRGYANQPELCSQNGVRMEIGFPPTKQSAVTGHGCEQQLLRDYLSYSIAIYDEVPGWYEFVGGRFYNQFVPARNEYYASSYYPQGTSYNAMRFHFDLYSAALIKAATGANPYSTDLHSVIYGLFTHATSIFTLDYFKVGDVRTSTTTLTSSIGACALISSHLYGDDTLRGIASLFPSGYKTFTAGVENTSAVEFIIWTSGGTGADADFASNLPLITYYGGFVGQIIARGSWTEESAVVLMKIQERTTANHDHAAAGNFQIYYKGMLTGDTGDYGGTSYSSDHCKYYLRATVSHNGLLIYNPALAETQKGYYTGGQKVDYSEAKTLDEWHESYYDTATVVGYSYGYGANSSSKYAYIAGDLTKSYDAQTVDYVGRTMLTVYTNDPNCPMLTFVFDRIDSKSETFKKTFLLQIPGESAPVIDEASKTVTVTNGDGKLVLTNLIGADTITGVGGTAQDGTRLNYQVNGKQLSFIDGSEIKDGTSWGRVEISADLESKVDIFFNIIAVTDKDKEITHTANIIEATTDSGNALLKGATVGGVNALFPTDTKRISESVRFVTSGDGLNEYYIGGLYTGTWTVSLDGERLGTVYATGDSGFVYFKAPAGEITLTPSDDIRPANSGAVSFVTGGGSFTKKPFEFYPLGEVTELPTDITRGDDTFLGWYSDPEYKNPITEIPSDAGESFTVYAKWATVIVSEDYSVTSINGAGRFNGIQYAAGKNNSVAITDYSYKTESGALIWSAPIAGTHIYKPAEAVESTALSYRFEFAKNGENTPLNVVIRFRESVSCMVNFLRINDSGEVRSGDDSFKLFDLTDEMQAVTAVVDFKAGVINYYTDSEIAVYSQIFTVPKSSTAESTLEFLGRLEQMFNIYASGTQRKDDSDTPSIKIGSIKLTDGDTMAVNDEPEEELTDRIVYNTNGGIFTSPVDVAYTPGETKKLATNIKASGAIFSGWYADEALTVPVSEVPASAVGVYNVYAKWSAALINEDYGTTVITGASTKNNISYAAGKNGSVANTDYTFKTDGEGALIFGAGANGTYIKANPQPYTSSIFTYEIELAKNGSNTPLFLSFRAREASSSSKSLYLFKIKENGGVYAHDEKALLFTLGEEMVNLKIAVDFAEGMLYYLIDGENTLTLPFSVPSGSDKSSTLEWQASLDQLFNMVAATTTPSGEGDSPSIKIGCIKVFDGGVYFPKNEVNDTESERIVYNLNGGELGDGVSFDYIKGEVTPLSTDVTRAGYNFGGWYLDANFTVRVYGVPADAEGAFEVYAKWNKRLEINNSCDVSALKTLNIHECTNHTAANANEAGICKDCGYCTEANADICPFYKRPSSATTCTACGKEFKKSSTLGVINGNDGALGYGKGITLDDGNTPVVTVVSRDGAHLTMNGDLYRALFDESGAPIATKLVFCVDLGLPTEAQYLEPVEGKNFVILPDGSAPMDLGIRLGKSGYYSEMLVRVIDGVLTLTDSADDSIAQLNVGALTSLRIELDFSEAIANDGTADKITVSVYGENGELLGSCEKQTLDGKDISVYSETILQLRAMSGGSIMIDNIRVYTE